MNRVLQYFKLELDTAQAMSSTTQLIFVLNTQGANIQQ